MELFSLLHTAHPLTAVGLMMLAGQLGAFLATRVGAPRVSGYLLAGMALSPSLLGVFTKTQVQHDFRVVTDMALGIIAFSIGGTLDFGQMRRLGRTIAWITVAQAMGAFLFTTLGVLLVFPLIAASLGQAETYRGLILPLALLLGAISTATAPAATLAVVHELRARGPLTTVLLGVVALDDGLALLFYAIALSAARNMVSGASLAPLLSLSEPLLHVATSLGIGAVACGVVWAVARRVVRAPVLLVVSLGCVFSAVGLAESVHASSLLTGMVLGCGVVNLVPQSHGIFEGVEGIEELIFGLFFVLAGAHLDVRVLGDAGGLALLLVACRFAGKLAGARAGASLVGAPAVIRKYLGLGLLPKAGVTVGLVLVAGELFGESPVTEVMVNAVLASVVINEVMSPLLVKYALKMAGETGTGR